MSNHYVTTIENLKTDIKIGITEKERLNTQTLFFNCIITHFHQPVGCVTDIIDDTVCYDTMCRQILEFSSERKFNLVESLLHYIYNKLVSNYDQCSFHLSVKKHPKVIGLEQGCVTFSIGKKI